MSNLTDIIQGEIYPRLFDSLDSVFQDWQFEKIGKRWWTPFHLDKTPSTKGIRKKSYVSSDKPHLLSENGGDTIDLLTLFMRENNIPENEVARGARELGGKVGYTLPEVENPEAYRAAATRQSRLQTIANKMTEALLSERGAKEFAYLRDPKEQGGRGYGDTTEEFIRAYNFGLVTPEFAEELKPLFWFKESLSGKNRNHIHKGIGRNYTLAFPYVSGGVIRGFVFRSILPDEERFYIDKKGEKQFTQKYTDAFISEADKKDYNFFGLTGLKLNDAEQNGIVVVEGEIDALRASFVGIPNVVAASRRGISVEALRKAKAKGVTQVTILYDTEEKTTVEDTSLTPQERELRRNEKRVKNRADVVKSLNVIHAEGLSSFVCYLNEEEDGKTDVDSYLLTHSKEDLQAAIKNAPSGATFLLFEIINQAIAEQGGEGETCSDKVWDRAARKILKLLEQSFVSRVEADKIMLYAEQCTNGTITRASLQKTIEEVRAAEAQTEQTEKTKALAEEIIRLSNDGRTEEALTLAANKLPEVRSISSEAEFSEFVSFPSLEQVKQRVESKPKGLHSGYFFEDERGNKEELLLPSGALTYICAPTSHGKSRMLENLAINLATDGNKGTTLYITYEETTGDTQDELLNIFANITLSEWNNLHTIAELRSGDYTHLKDKRYSNGQKNLSDFKTKEAEFYDLLTTKKRLLIVSKEWDSTKLAEYIRFAAKKLTLKAVIIDYVQLLRTKGYKASRKDELEAICRELMAVSKDIEIPVILAAQLNRDVLSPLDMDVQNIADASNIEHSANVIMLLWSSHKDARNGSGGKGNSYYKSKTDKNLTEDAQNLDKRGYRLGVRGKLYATLAKNRGGKPNITAVFDYNMNTGKITPNPPEDGERQSQQRAEPQQSNPPLEAPTEEDERAF